MNKDEILNKSRESKKDEGAEFIESKGVQLGLVIFIVISFFMIIFNEVVGLKSFDIYTLTLIFLSTESITKYRFTHKKRYVIITIFYVTLGIISLLAYIDTSLR